MENDDISIVIQAQWSPSTQAAVDAANRTIREILDQMRRREEEWMENEARSMAERVWADAWHVQGTRQAPRPEWHYEVFQVSVTARLTCTANRDLRCTTPAGHIAVGTMNDPAREQCVLMPLCHHHFGLWAQKCEVAAGDTAALIARDQPDAPSVVRWEPLVGAPAQQYVLGLDGADSPVAGRV